MSRERWSDQELSAYLDGHLDQAAQVALEADLARDPVLRRQVAELRQTVTLLRALPLREPPRNFLLTPAMVAPPRPQRRPLLLPFMRLTTALAGLAFILTVGLQLLPNAGARPAAAPVLESTQAMEAPAAMVAQEEAPEEAIQMRSFAETGEPATGARIAQADTPVPAPATAEDSAAIATTPEPEPQLERGGIGSGGGEPFLPPGVSGGDENAALTPSPEPKPSLVTPLPYPTPTCSANQKGLALTPTPMANQTAYLLPPTASPQPSTGTGLVHEERKPLARRELLPGWLAPILGSLTLALGIATWWLARHK